MQEDIKFPDVNYGEDNKEIYLELTTSSWSPFSEHTYWEVFIFCMSYAYAKKIEPLDPKGKGTLNAKLFLKNTRHLMRALAIDHFNDLSVIKDSTKVVRICEQFANAGIREINHKFKNRPSEKSIISVFLEMEKEIEQNRK